MKELLEIRKKKEKVKREGKEGGRKRERRKDAGREAGRVDHGTLFYSLESITDVCIRLWGETKSYTCVNM